MNNQKRDQLFKEAFALLARAQTLILAARAKHEQGTAQPKKAA